MKIKVNGKEMECGQEHLTYGDVAELTGHKRDDVVSITYTTTRPGDEQRSGILSPGRAVKIEDGMLFDGHITGNA